MTSSPSWGLLTDPEEMGQLLGRLTAEAKPVGFDVETGYLGETREKASLHPEENFLAGISFSSSPDWARYIPLRHDSGVNADGGLTAYLFWKLLTARDAAGFPLGVAHNAKFERRCMARWFLQNLARHPEVGPEVIAARGYPLIRSCTLLESYVEGDNRTHGLKEITAWNLGVVMTEILELFPEGLTAKQQRSIRFNVLDQHDPKVIAYACDDAHKALAHHLLRYPRVKDHPVYQVEMAVLREAVCEMEDTGIDYDWIRMRETAGDAEEFAGRYMFEIARDFESWLGRPLPPKFNFSSSQQLGWLLFGEGDKLIAQYGAGLSLPVVRRTETGRPSVNAKVALKGLGDHYDPVRKLLEWKYLTKLYRDFLRAYEEKYSWSADGRAHPSLIQHGTITGRTSAADPNPQQSPKKYKYELGDGTKFEHNFRDNIRAPLPGMRQWWEIILEELGLYKPSPEAEQLRWYILGFDWSQIELRVIAGEAGETALLDAFGRGDDVHRLTASLMLGVPAGLVTEDQRAVGKTMNFALVYGMSEEGLAERLGISRDEARELFARYHAAYPQIRKWMDRTIEYSHEHGCVYTKWGRKVRIWEYQDAEELDAAWAIRARRRAGERTAGNAPIQGSATGDYKKACMVHAQRALKRAGLADRVLLFMDVHDALEWYVREDVAPETVVRLLNPEVTRPVDGWPPMVAEWHLGTRWGSLIELELLPDGTVRPKQKAKVIEAAPGEEPGEEQEYLPVLPAARTALPQPEPAARFIGEAAWAPEPQPDAWQRDPRTVYVELPQVPTPEQAGRFGDLLASLPGPDSVILRVDGYDDIPVPGESGLGPQHSPQVSVIFGSALVYYDLDSVDMAALTAGLDI